MRTNKQIMSLVKQELRSASRTRYIIFSFIVLPIFMWLIQGGVQLFVGMSIVSSQKGETIYFVSYDTGISTENGSINLSDDLLEALIASTQDNTSLLSGATINSTKYADFAYAELVMKINNSQTANDFTPCIIIPNGFTYNYLYNDITIFELYTLPGGLIGSSMLEASIYTIISQPPFTEVDVKKATLLDLKTVTFPGEEDVASGFGVGFVGFISVLVAVMAPAPFVSTSFAGEREKKTMESLLALPISRFNILLSKVLAGLALVSIFALMNIVGLFGFAAMMNIASESIYSDIGATSYLAIDASITLIILITIAMFLSAFVSIGLGISIASFMKDVRSAESAYSMLMVIPAMIVGITSMFGSVPENSYGGAGIILYIIPWAHAIAILAKGLYPQTYASVSLTGSIPLDIAFHLGYLIFIILVCLFIASRVFEREGILT
jgi:ABC-type Na+ efflux pump permease subunit